MKKLLITSWILFTLGLIFKLFHFPASGELLILGSLLLIIHSIIFLFKNAKTNLPFAFLHLSIALWTIYLLFRVKFWGGWPEILGFNTLFIIPFLATLIWFSLHLVRHSKFKLPQYLLIVYTVFSIILSYIHSDKIFYFFNLNTVINSESRNQDYYSWDKYSWFLYISDKKIEALEANKNAQKAVNENLKTTRSDEAVKFSSIIKQHEEQIRNDNWTTYP